MDVSEMGSANRHIAVLELVFRTGTDTERARKVHTKDGQLLYGQLPLAWIPHHLERASVWRFCVARESLEKARNSSALRCLTLLLYN